MFGNKTTITYVIVLFSLNIFFVENSFARTSREVVNDKFENVGLIHNSGKNGCTGTIIKHGVILTAKHCFGSREIGELGASHFSVSFISARYPLTKAFLINGNDIKRIVPDTGNNDIAYMLYEPKATEEKIDLVVNQIQLSVPSKETPALIIGYPTQTNNPEHLSKIISRNCSFDGVSSEYTQMVLSNQYHGRLYQTSCAGFYGNSGGPVIIRDNLNRLKLIGVVTHTFSVDSFGQILEKRIETDPFGQYIADANVSLLSDAKSLSNVLSLDITKIHNNALLSDELTQLGPLREYRSSDLDSDAFSFFYPQLKKPALDESFETQSVEKIFRRRSEYGDANLNCSSQFNRVKVAFDNIIKKNKLESKFSDENFYLALSCNGLGPDANYSFGVLFLTGEIVNLMDTDGKLTCLISHELSHRLLKHDRIRVGQAQQELDADALATILTVRSGYGKQDCRDFVGETSVFDAHLDGYPSSFERLLNINRMIFP